MDTRQKIKDLINKKEKINKELYELQHNFRTFGFKQKEIIV